MLSFETKKAYYNLKPRNYISWDYYQNYINVEPPFGQLGVPVSIRTYHRYVPELNRREKWCEVVLRVVEYSLSLDTITTHENKVTEAEELFDCLFNLRGFAAGRTYWVGGTEQTERDSSANWNCCYRAVTDISAFSEIYYWLLIGAGVGFGIEKKNVSQLPKLYSGKTLVHQDYEFKGFENKEDYTLIYSNTFNILLTKSDLTKSDQEYRQIVECVTNNLNVTIVVGDSKEGWCNALRTLLTLYTFPEVERIYINYNNVRPEGSLIKIFGGRASGHRGILNTLRDIHWLIEEAKGILSSRVCLDICNVIARDVASGGVRRSSEIGLFGVEDTEVATAKVGLFDDPAKEKYRDIRVMSNNSVLLYTNPGFENIKYYLECLRDQGDPGFWVVGNAKKSDSRVEATNPCGEVALRNKQTCNLTTNNVSAHILRNKSLYYSSKLDYLLMERTIRLTTRMGSRITTVSQWHPDWDRVQKEDRLLGVSLTGIQDAFDELGWNAEHQKDFYQWAATIIRDEADRYHIHLGIPRSTRVSLIKPEGTLSQLPTVSSGVHKGYAPYYKRRIRFSKTDPLAQALKDVGIPVVPENKQGYDYYPELSIEEFYESRWMSSFVDWQEYVNVRNKRLRMSLDEILHSPECSTWVFTFPVQSPTPVRAIDEDVVTQLERYKLAQNNYVRDGHNCSFTATLNHDEYDTAAKWLNDNWDSVIGVTFLPRFDPVEGGKALYPNMPYEPCTKEQYLELKALVPDLKEEQLLSLLQRYEKSYEEQELDTECSTGACPIR